MKKTTEIKMDHKPVKNEIRDVFKGKSPNMNDPEDEFSAEPITSGQYNPNTEIPTLNPNTENLANWINSITPDSIEETDDTISEISGGDAADQMAKSATSISSNDENKIIQTLDISRVLNCSKANLFNEIFELLTQVNYIIERESAPINLIKDQDNKSILIVGKKVDKKKVSNKNKDQAPITEQKHKENPVIKKHEEEIKPKKFDFQDNIIEEASLNLDKGIYFPQKRNPTRKTKLTKDTPGLSDSDLKNQARKLREFHTWKDLIKICLIKGKSWDYLIAKCDISSIL